MFAKTFFLTSLTSGEKEKQREREKERRKKDEFKK
jgi:hypothetical protein